MSQYYRLHFGDCGHCGSQRWAITDSLPEAPVQADFTEEVWAESHGFMGEEAFFFVWIIWGRLHRKHDCELDLKCWIYRERHSRVKVICKGTGTWKNLVWWRPNKQFCWLECKVQGGGRECLKLGPNGFACPNRNHKADKEPRIMLLLISVNTN